MTDAPTDTPTDNPVCPTCGAFLRPLDPPWRRVSKPMLCPTGHEYYVYCQGVVNGLSLMAEVMMAEKWNEMLWRLQETINERGTT